MFPVCVMPFPLLPALTRLCFTFVLSVSGVICVGVMGVCAVLFPRFPIKFCCTLVFCFIPCVFFLFLCFSSQTTGLFSAFSSAPVKFVTRFCCVLVCNFVLRVCLPNTGFVQCYSLDSREVCYTLVFCFIQ